ncbi:MAG: AraC family transcriptional regulator [Lachnospiraceae bacterium]|nr:AraC family transcriptional regulator [Lachnospiraceae bacterium]
MDIQREMFYKEFVQRENYLLHAPYNPELEFYSCIKEGNVHKIKQLCQNEPLVTKKGLGKLSDDYLQHMKYHFVVTAALAARYCIEGGMELSQAYGISDFYIQKADKCKTATEISELHCRACVDYAQRMKSLRRAKICSLPVVKCIDYICDSLHTRITVDTLAKHTGLNASYLSCLFKKETGQTISGYIRDKKIETACNMLIYSEYTPVEISSMLAFSSQSYFTEIFRKKTGLTPKKYQSLYFRNTHIGES